MAAAEGLLAEFPPAPARVLVAQADRAGRRSPTGSPRAGHTVEAVVAYRTVARRPSPTRSPALASVDAVVLASGSAADGAGPTRVGGVDRAVVVAIGPGDRGRRRAAAGLAVAHVAHVAATRSSVSDAARLGVVP